MAASQAITDNFIKFRASKGEPVSSVSLSTLHKLAIEEILHGYDVLPSAVHLTASTLALLAPDTCFDKMRLYSLPFGRKESDSIYLGSIDYISADTIQTQLDLMSPSVSAQGVGRDMSSVAPLPMLDLCVMNPPFVRSVGGNLLFGSVPDDRNEMQGELARRIKKSRLSASSTVGLGSVFTAIGDKHVKNDGRLALVLPAAILTGVAWKKTRDLLVRNYVLETVITSHDPERWNFSENTDLSEVMLIARKRSSKDSRAVPAQTQFINLWHNPRNSAHALAAGEQLIRGAAAPIGSAEDIRHGISEIAVGTKKFGETLEIPWEQVRREPWIGGAFAQTNLIRAAWFLRHGQLYQPGHKGQPTIPLTHLHKVATLGPDRRDIADGFTVSHSPTAYPALMGHRADETTTIQLSPNKWLAPRVAPAKGRPLRDAAVLWGRAGSLMIAERSWLNTQRTLAVRLPEASLANVWWPVCLKDDSEDASKLLALWLNSTLGLLTMLAHRVPTRGAWIQFKKPTLENLPILDGSALSPAAVRRIVSAYDNIATATLGRFTDMGSDPIRVEIDRLFSHALELPPLDGLRMELAREPIITLRPCFGDMPEADTPENIQFELL